MKAGSRDRSWPILFAVMRQLLLAVLVIGAHLAHVKPFVLDGMQATRGSPTPATWSAQLRRQSGTVRRSNGCRSSARLMRTSPISIVSDPERRAPPIAS